VTDHSSDTAHPEPPGALQQVASSAPFKEIPADMKSKWKKIVIRYVPAIVALIAVAVEVEDELSKLTGRKWL
jgi:hypothetical protein